jgi:hypothetical protein
MGLPGYRRYETAGKPKCRPARSGPEGCARGPWTGSWRGTCRSGGSGGPFGFLRNVGTGVTTPRSTATALPSEKDLREAAALVGSSTRRTLGVSIFGAAVGEDAPSGCRALRRMAAGGRSKRSAAVIGVLRSWSLAKPTLAEVPMKGLLIDAANALQGATYTVS